MDQLTPVLLIDDDPVIREALMNLLNTRGYTCTAVSTAELALSAIKSTRFDLILTDFQLPDEQDGLDIIRVAKALNTDRPVVMISGQGDMQIVIQALRNGVDDFISKPFKPAELISIVQREIDQYHRKGITPDAAPAIAPMQLDGIQLTALEHVLARLRYDANARCVMLLEGNGHIISAKGVVGNVDISALAALVAGEFASSTGIATLIGEEDPFQVSYHQGTVWSVYAAFIGPGMYMIVIFSQDVRSGMVLYETRQAVEKIQQTLGPDYFKNLGTIGSPGVELSLQPDPESSEYPEMVKTIDDMLNLSTLDDDLVASLQEQFNRLWTN
jgi:DNA-binding response OmpR family regulator